VRIDDRCHTNHTYPLGEGTVLGIMDGISGERGGIVGEKGGEMGDSISTSSRVASVIISPGKEAPSTIGGCGVAPDPAVTEPDEDEDGTTTPWIRERQIGSSILWEYALTPPMIVFKLYLRPF
jgi:hypothetical protein